jgi:hypothetical protein
MPPRSASAQQAYNAARQARRASFQSGQQTGSQPGTQTRRTIIRLVNGRLPWSLNEVEQVVLAEGGCGLYHRAGMVVRPIKVEMIAADQRKTFSWQVHEVSAVYLTDLLTRFIRFQTFDVKADDWLDKDCPKKIAEAYLARVGEWEIPELRGIVNTPFLREDGSLCETPGYDPASKLLFNPDGQSFPTIPTAQRRRDQGIGLHQQDALRGVSLRRQSRSRSGVKWAADGIRSARHGGSTIARSLFTERRHRQKLVGRSNLDSTHRHPRAGDCLR